MFELPLFPLNTVLFPGIPFQLHIFEARYQEMIGNCLATGDPFGVVLIKQGREAMGPLAKPYSIGCTARIISEESLPQGRLNITVVGQERFRIHSLTYERPYLVGQVELFPFRVDDPVALALAADGLRPLVMRYLQALMEANDQTFDSDGLPDGPLELAYVAAYVLQTSMSQKQTLLSQRGALGFVNGLRSLYPREIALLDVILENRAQVTIGSFSAN